MNLIIIFLIITMTNRLLDDDNGGTIGFPEIQKTLDLCNAKVIFENYLWYWWHWRFVPLLLKLFLNFLKFHARWSLAFFKWYIRHLSPCFFKYQDFHVRCSWAFRIFDCDNSKSIDVTEFGDSIKVKLSCIFFLLERSALLLILSPSGSLEDIWRSWWVWQWARWKSRSDRWGPGSDLLVSRFCHICNVYHVHWPNIIVHVWKV